MAPASCFKQAPDAGGAHIRIFKFAGCFHRIGNKLFHAGFGQIGSPRIADENQSALARIGAQPGLYPLRQWPLIAKVADQHHVPARIVRADDVVPQNLN